MYKFHPFCIICNNQQKNDQEAYSRIFLVPQFETNLVSNTYAKQILESYESEKEFFPTQQSSHLGRGTPKRTKQNRRKKTKQQTKKDQTAKKVLFCLLREKP